ncbi:hypothetical protein [Massilia yuzhufengensis]|uniref:Uncharacterized protein n=1 Tax=Massilia yuzhufengensis TaxID=1164594 RepID=A0A1I1NTP7_9BURK|nr:hypothetical protein [Massilia yuzhufengensis]SFD00927.1 hypothetical protein SAMN05216204_11432 [Massilia yuzhufengensis]
MHWLTHACRALLATLLAGACGVAFADGAATLDPGEWAAVDADTLDNARGGFQTVGGLNLSLGIERVISINGEVLSRTNVAIADVANMNASQVMMAREALGSAQLIQMGVNNFAPGDIGLASGATLVQNSLDNQAILAHTTITSTVNSMALIKDLNFHSTIRDGIMRGAGSL